MAVLMGLLNQDNLKDRRVSTLPIEEVTDAINQTLAAHNALINTVIDTFCRRTTEIQMRFKTPVNARLQPVDEDGRALPVQGINYYTIGFPIQAGAHAWGANYVTRQKMTVEELSQELVTAQLADINWVRDHILAALFYKSSTNPWTFPDKRNGDISVYGLANGDTVTYQFKNAAAMATDTHVLGASSLTTTIAAAAAANLKEHPENGSGPVVLFVPTASKATVQGFTDFVPISDPNLSYGTVTTTLTGRVPQSIPGEVFGYLESAGAFVSEWTTIPDNYLIGIMPGGEKPLAMREDAEDNLRGYQMIGERENVPWWERQFLRRAGFGAWNRVGAIVYETDNATYSIPSNYTSPMA